LARFLGGLGGGAWKLEGEAGVEGVEGGSPPADCIDSLLGSATGLDDSAVSEEDALDVESILRCWCMRLTFVDGQARRIQGMH